MAMPIRETPILFGEDARRFEEEMRNAKCTITREEYDDMMKSYRAVLASLERGEASRKARLAKKKKTMNVNFINNESPMPDIYTSVPTYETNNYLLRFVQESDANDLLAVYSDKNALPFFNSDNCHGDNFYYPNLDRMKSAVNFWLSSYQSKWFVRWSIIDKTIKKAIGSIELFNREADDAFDNVGLLRLDLRSDYEKADIIEEIANLIIEPAYSLFYTDRIITKVPLYAVERQAAFTKLGFTKSEEYLIGSMDGHAYKDYWERIK